MKARARVLAFLVVLLATCLGAAAWAGAPAQGSPQATPATASASRPAGAVGTVVVPDRFLRRWDPVTIFLAADAGPAAGGPEDHPERVVEASPAHPGAWRWLDARTLQFRPAEPWPALARFSFEVEGRTSRLTTLMAAPVETSPRDGAEGLDPVDEVALTFPEPLEKEALSRMVSLELRPLPGLGEAPGRVLGRDDFEVKAVERTSRADRAGYVLVLKEPIGLGLRALVRLRLALDEPGGASFKDLSFSTAEPFRVTGAGCRERRMPISPGGSRYAREQVLRCGAERPAVVVEFSAAPAALGPVEGRNLVRFAPAVKDLSFSLQGRTLEVAGRFDRDTLYSVSVVPTPLVDSRNRPLEMKGPSELFLTFPRQAAFLRWGASQGIVERLGPQMVPVQGRGQERVDLRIHPVGALDRSFWPFPDRPLVVDESSRPPGPGEEPEPHTDGGRDVTAHELVRHIRTLGSPPVSALVDLPLRREGVSAAFGLDLAPHLERIGGKGRPGTYLVGIRELGGGSQRSWMRVQVTDLTLSTVEEPRAVRFVVTSLSTGRPVLGSRVRVEGSVGGASWTTLAEGTTDADGAFRFTAPGPGPDGVVVRRIVAEKDGDTLVLDASRPPEGFADNQWSDEDETWLQWAFSEIPSERGPQRETLCHVFTERPVYRPEEPVHVKGWVRHREAGRLRPVRLDGFVVVQGPGDLGWSYPASPSETGGFYHRFTEKDLPTGTYRVRFEDSQRRLRCGETSFQVEAYRVPRFEVNLHAPETARLDEAFTVSLTASYYAGGRVGGQPVEWRVTQFPQAWTPSRREGFQYSSDGRFSRTGRFQSSPRLTKEDATAEDGTAHIDLNPAVEPTAEPRSYLVEATVTGPDDQTVTATRTIPALPPFVLGLKVPRYLEKAKAIDGELIVVGNDGKEVADREVTVRLLRREWHSHLRPSDFTDGVARYVTDVVDEKVQETSVRSTAAPLPLHLPIDRAGVYVVELESHDRLGRAQVVSVDLYAGGEQAVTWPKPPTRVFSVATDKARYRPGDTAAVVLKSPFQAAQALAVVEAPEGNRYEWLAVEGGAATYRLPILPTFTPRVPVHFVLMRGRLPGTTPLFGNGLDLGKPTTMAATAWLEVEPTGNRVEVALKHPETARPGQTIDVTVTLKDPKGLPLPGEVTLWLVDQAVLALGKERRLDPVPDFITPVRSHLEVHDSRNLAFGAIAFAENPGGDGGDEEAGLLDRATVRKNFQSVPFYDPAVVVGPSGTVTVEVKLSDDLTNFKIRAKAASGPERFGFGTGHLAVRLPVIVQPALPRFVRPGDAFTASAIGRVVEGSGGPGAAEARVEGVRLTGPGKRDLTWVEGRPERVDFPVEVPTPASTPEGRPALGEATFRMGVSRASDGATDAFEVRLPVRPDREKVSRRVLKDVDASAPLVVPALTEAAREGTLRRTVMVSSQPALVRMAAGLDFLLQYPHGCTEQQVSRARSYVALRRFRTALKAGPGDKEVDRAVKDTMAWIPTVVDGEGLVAYWPGRPGNVSLTAWSLQFLLEAKDAGFPVDPALVGRLTTVLQRALRSDYGRFVDGESWAERAWALAALAQAGKADAAYAAELSRKAESLDLEGVAQVLQTFGRSKQQGAAVDALARSLWDGLIVRLHQGREIYGGLQERRATRSGLILPSETRTLGEVTRAVLRTDAKHPRLGVLVDALVTLGRDDGWGTTNANAAALLALSEALEPGGAAGAERTVRVRLDGREQTVVVGPKAPVAFLSGTTTGPVEVSVVGGTTPVAVRVETSYVPAADGSQAAASSAGFVVSRELVRIAPNEPEEKTALAAAGTTQTLSVGDVVEERLQVVNPKDRHYVAIVLPLAAGLEPLNPNLATAPPEARPSRGLTRAPSYVAWLDDRVAFYYDTLPAGTYDFAFRSRATTPGRFVQPPALAEMMYDANVRATSFGARIEVVRK